MGYTEGVHDQPADTKDRLVRVGTKYQSSVPTLTDGDNAYLLVDSAGRVISSIRIANSGWNDGVVVARTIKDDSETGRLLAVAIGALAPDGSHDRVTTAMDTGVGLGALNVAPIGGDVTLRASAVAGEASGTSTAVSRIGWIKDFHGVLDVTAVPSGGTPTLDAYLQTQLADGTWQDIAHFTQVTGSATKEILAWKGTGATEAGTQAEAAAVTVDNYFTNEDAALAVTTVRLLPLGDSMRVKWVFAAGGSTGDYTFSVDISAHG